MYACMYINEVCMYMRICIHVFLYVHAPITKHIQKATPLTYCCMLPGERGFVDEVTDVLCVACSILIVSAISDVLVHLCVGRQ